METLNKILHPKQTLHKTDDDTEFAGTQTPPPPPPQSSSPPTNPDGNDPRRPNQQTLDALTSEPNVTGTDRPAPKHEFPSNQHHHDTTATTTTGEQDQDQDQDQYHPKISRAHHHPRQPIGATGLPPNHRPADECNPGGA